MPEAKQRVVIRWVPNSGRGWEPIRHLVHLTKRLLDAEIEEISKSRLQAMRRIRRTLIFPPKFGEDVAIHLAYSPADIATHISNPFFDKPVGCRVLWIVDSFWTEWIPKGLLSNFDLVVYMQSGEKALYDYLSKGRALFLGWGSDVLDLGSASGARDIDVLRLGRQPLEWDDDARSAAVARVFGMQFHGRPHQNISHAELMRHYARSRFIVAFSNLVAPAQYTHPTKAYYTARWTDALACGAVVAGIPPHQDIGVSSRLWDGALLEFDYIDLERNMEVLSDAVARWSPETARRNYVNALMNLDWRWGIKCLADQLNLVCPTLEADIHRLQAKAQEVAAAS